MPSNLDQHEKDPSPAALSDEQFAELKELLRPGYELSSMMLAQYKAGQVPDLRVLLAPVIELATVALAEHKAMAEASESEVLD